MSYFIAGALSGLFFTVALLFAVGAASVRISIETQDGELPKVKIKRTD